MAEHICAQAHRIGPRKTTHVLRAALFGVSALVAATTGASSQALLFPRPFFDDGPGPLIPPRAIVYRLRDEGFSEIGRPRFDGAAYIIDATSPAGARLRLFVDARDGDLIGRRRLDGPAEPAGRMVRAAPGYGWTEDDTAPRRGPREAEALIPPADIPGVSRPPRAEAALAPAGPGRSGPENGGTFGLNPDAAAERAPRSVPARRAARPGTPKAQAARAMPDAAAPHTEPGAPEAAQPAVAAPATKAAATPERPDRSPPTPAENQPRATDAAARDAVLRPSSTDQNRQESPAAKQAASAAPEPKRTVRVIGGATIVPGAGQSTETGAN